MNRMMSLCVRAALILSVAGCASSRAAMEPRGAGSEQPTQTAERLLIKRGALTVVVKDVALAAKAAERAVKDAGGYVESCRRGESEVEMTVRAPAGKLEEVMDVIARLGSATSREVSAEDVTDQVMDLEAQLKNKTALRNRLRKLLDRAKDVKDVLAIEEQLTRVQTEIDTLAGRLKRMKGRVAMSRLRVNLKRRTVYGPLGLLFVGIKWAATKLFVLSGPGL